MLTVCLLSVVLTAGAIPDLTEAQRVQLDTADDTRPPDEPAWTGLLSNVAAWDPAEAARDVVPGSTTPDVERLIEAPSVSRGGLFMVQGRFAGRQRAMRTVRGGPWGEALVEWGVAVPTGQPGEDRQRIVMVYLVDPEGEVQPPREGQRVRVLTRFYKLWQDADAEGVQRTYPVFVGRSPVVVGRSVDSPVGSSAVIVGVVVVGGAMLFGLMAKLRRAGRVSRRAKVQERLRGEAEAWDEDAEGGVPLPEDPAAALEQLERSRGDV